MDSEISWIYQISVISYNDDREVFMTDILIRDIDESLDKALKVRAIEHGRTREAEIKVILTSVISRYPKKRSLADALMDIPKLDADVDHVFERSGSPARNMDG